MDASPGPLPVTFLFPGQGSQYPGMARELYEHQPAFRDRVDECAGSLEPGLGASVRRVLLGEPASAAAHDGAETAQPALFTLEYALAGLWRSWGLSPSCVLGHSLGAYAAACTADVLSVADALALVVARGRLLGSLPAGAMLAVFLPENDLGSLLPGELSVAAVNDATQCVVSGSPAVIARFEAELAERRVESLRLRISSPAHSHLLDPVLAEFGAHVRDVELRAPAVPWISDTNGEPVGDDDARDPRYWVSHLRRTVRFADALSTAMDGEPKAFLEVGPGDTLITLARRRRAAAARHTLLTSLPGRIERTSALGRVLGTAGVLRTRGFSLAGQRVSGDVDAFSFGEKPAENRGPGVAVMVDSSGASSDTGEGS
ncbi:acyltransferase domain-containing protein [Amycolatopsis sp., V23-08]|uniref:Acyltransferase domain-containing protein n=1 Tax=Amycolatopsis heterodermiae TaxID=3110235 RepID=A0ABU5R8R9_9PSEU|nr:acyltransferase domain-containing protein [Amycolatopsis sp., V23-08]MEA5362608.1 acyltransferase domain-containing protein [Amycolatopsis sp., V23-08]